MLTLANKAKGDYGLAFETKTVNGRWASLLAIICMREGGKNSSCIGDLRCWWLHMVWKRLSRCLKNQKARSVVGQIDRSMGSTCYIKSQSPLKAMPLMLCLIAIIKLLGVVILLHTFPWWPESYRYVLSCMRAAWLARPADTALLRPVFCSQQKVEATN
jgi:hypothetical protein